MNGPLTRRQLLGGLGGAAVAGTAASQVPVRTVEFPAPRPGTWPSGDYDTANTRANPHTALSQSPTEAWRTETVEGVQHLYHDRLVVGTDYVFAAGNRLVALDKHTGTVEWERPVAGRDIAVYGDALFHFGSDPSPDGGGKQLTCFEASTGTRQWQVPTRPSGFFVTSTAVLCTDADGNLTAFDRADGTAVWTSSRRHVRQGGSELGIVGWDTSLVRYEDQRRVLDVATNTGPPIAWERDNPFYRSPVVAGEQLIGSLEVSNADATAGPALVAIDLATGTRNWGTLVPEQLDREELRDDYAPLTPVVSASRGYTALNLTQPDRASLFAVDLERGRVQWRRRLEGAVTAMALADGQFLVSTQSSPADSYRHHGKVVGFATQDGRELWRLEFDSYVQRFAVCDGTVFAALLDTSVVAIQ